MKRKIMVLPAILFLVSFGSSAALAGPAKPSGEALFKEHCAVCHPDGSNIMNPKKTLSRTDREAHGIKTSADILKLVRTPGPGMTTFDTKTLSDRDAKLIAEYVLKTFTK